MKPERAFVAERPLAQHCAELVRAGPGPAELAAALEHAGARIARRLPLALYPLLGTMADVECGKPGGESYEDFAEFHPLLAANSLLTVNGAPVLATIDAVAVLSLVDRAFGGKGEPPAQMPRAFALSAELMIQKLEELVCASLSAALGLDDSAVRARRRDGSLPQLAPFASSTRLSTLRLTVTEEGRGPWTITLAFPAETLGSLFGHGERPAPRPRPPSSPLAAPFAELPLTLRAVLVDMALPLSRFGALEVGQVLPVAVSRQVPVMTGTATVAHGMAGAEDDRVAIQITQIP